MVMATPLPEKEGQIYAGQQSDVIRRVELERIVNANTQRHNNSLGRPAFIILEFKFVTSSAPRFGHSSRVLHFSSDASLSYLPIRPIQTNSFCCARIKMTYPYAVLPFVVCTMISKCDKKIISDRTGPAHDVNTGLVSFSFSTPVSEEVP